MYATGIDLSETKRAQLIELCNAALADAVDLQLHCKHEHWNVKGPNFIALHQLFDQVNENVEDYIDLIAERAVQLGGIANSQRMWLRPGRICRKTTLKPPASTTMFRVSLTRS